MRQRLSTLLTLLALSTVLTSVHLLGQITSGTPDQLVQQLGEFTAALPGIAPSNGRPDPTEERRANVYRELVSLGEQARPALLRGLAGPDVQVRRNVALFLDATSSSWWNVREPRLNLQPFLVALISALEDADARVRQMAAEAVGNYGPNATSAIAALVKLLMDADPGARQNACNTLGLIGPAAKEALPELHRLTSDPYARPFAERAIKRIDVER